MLSLILIMVSFQTLFAEISDDDLEEYKLTPTEFMGYQKLKNTQCIGIGGYDEDLVRDYVGSAKECKALCDTYENCAGFVRVNGPKTSQFYGKCYLRADGLQTPFPYTGDNRDCYRSVRYTRTVGNQCWGTGTDVLRDFEGNPRKCAIKCDSMDDCVGFIRVKSGSQYAGKCYFRGGSLEAPYPYTGDKRDCYAPDDRIRADENEIDNDAIIYTDEYQFDLMVNHVHGSVINGFLIDNNISVSIIMCVLLGVFIITGLLVLCAKSRTSKTVKSATSSTPLIGSV